MSDNRIEEAANSSADIHGMKGNAARLKEARDYAEAIVDTVAQPLVVLGADLRVITANTSYYRKFRTEPEETEDRLFYDLEGGRWNIPRLRTLLEGVSARDEFFENVQVDIEFMNAGRRSMLLNARRISGGDDQPRMILLSMDDVTERRQADKALRDAEKRLQRLQEIANVGIWELDLTANRLFWSDEVYRMFGLLPQEFPVTYEAFLETVHPGDRAAVDAAYSGSLREGRDTYEIEHRIVRRHTGEVRHVHEKCEHIRDETGRIIHSIGMVQDITERKQAEEALRKSHSFNQSIIDSSSDCIKVLDMEGRLQYMSPAGQHLLGIRDIEKYLNIPYEEFWKGTEHQAPLEAVRKAKQGYSGSFEGYCPTVCGIPKWWDVAITPIIGADGKPERLLAVSRDITERKRAEEELQKRTHDLRERVKELNCLYSISSLAGRQDITEGEILNGIIGLIPPAFQHPERVCARIVFENAEYRTENFVQTPWRLTAGVVVQETRAGVVEVCSLAEATAGDGDPFLNEERKLIDTIALQLGVIIGRLRMEAELRKSHHDLEVRIAERSRELIRNNNLLAAISGAQSRLISECEPHEIFGGMLTEILAITDSEYGFMGRVLTTPEGKPYLKMYAIKSAVGNDETRTLCERNAANGMDFRNLDTLFGAALKTGRPVIANDPARDPQSGGLPHGHPALRSFMGIPVYSGGNMIAMLGIANRPSGYREEMIAFLEPLLFTCATIVEALHINHNRKKAEEELRIAYHELQYRQMEIKALLESARSALKYRDFRDAARAIFTICKELTGAAGGYVALLSSDGTQNEVFYLDSGGSACTVDPSLPMPVRGLREVAYRNCRGVFHNNFRDSEWMEFIPEGHVSIENVLFSPLIIRGKVVGLFGLANKHGGFSEADVSMAAAFSDIAVIAYSNSLTAGELQESEKRYKTLVQSVTDYIYSVGIKDGVPAETKHGPGCIAVTGYSSEEFRNDPYLWYRIINEEDRAAVLRQANNIISGECIDPVEHRILRKDGSMRWVKNTVVRRFDDSGRLIAYDGLISDVTERKIAEEALLRTNRALKTLSRCNEKLAHASREQELLSDICEAIVLEGGYRFAWVGYAEHDERKTVRPVQQFGYEEGYLKKVLIYWADTEFGQGPTGSSIREGKPCVINDILKDSLFTPWREEASKQGYSSILGLPLFNGSEILGALTIYASEPDAFDGDEIRLLTELADNLSFGISSLRMRDAKQAVEASLKESENRYRTLFELATDAIFILYAEGDNAGSIVAANRAGAEMHGYTVDELEDMHVIELDAPETAEKSPELLQEILQGGILKTELYHKKKDGEIFPLEVSAGLLELQGHKYILAFYRDITERKKAEDERDRLIAELQDALQSVSRSQKAWLDTFDSITDHISIIDKDFTILKANKSFAGSYGFHPKDIIGKKCYEVVHGIHSPVEHCPHATTLQERSQVTREILDPKTKGVFRVSTFPYHSPEEDFIGSIHIARDITIEKEKEIQLIKSEKLASLGQLSAGMAHEINNPINFIMANAQLLSEIWADVLKILRLHYEEQGDFMIGGFSFSENQQRITRLFSGIEEGSHRIKNIVANLKAFTRARTIEYEEPVDISRVIRASLMILESQIKRFTDNFILQMEEGLPRIKGSNHNLEQVVSNLIMNALQSLPARTCGVMLSVRLDRGGNCIIIQVRDEGVGMSGDVMEKACSPFFTTKRESGGIGLGLSICRSIIDDHRGSLEFDSRPGEGTMATVKLPLMTRSGLTEEGKV